MAIYGNFVRSTLYIVMKDIDVDEVERLYFAGKTYEFENNLRILKEKVRAKYLYIFEVKSDKEIIYLADGSSGAEYSAPLTTDILDIKILSKVMEGNVLFNPYFTQENWGTLSGAYAQLFDKVGIGLEYDVEFLVSEIDINLRKKISNVLITCLSSVLLLYFLTMFVIRKMIERKVKFFFEKNNKTK